MCNHFVLTGKIKRICETELGIVSQCCQPKQVVKMNKQYLENLALKINVKVEVIHLKTLFELIILLLKLDNIYVSVNLLFLLNCKRVFVDFI